MKFAFCVSGIYSTCGFNLTVLGSLGLDQLLGGESFLGIDGG
jgi:hypothetical protein